MRISKNTILVIVLFVFSFANAQKIQIEKVSIADLEEKIHPKDPGAEAAILFKKGETNFTYSDEKGFEMITKVKTRIKIYKKEGYKWADQSQKYYIDGSSKENMRFSDAVTYNLVNGKIEKTKLKSDGDFDEKINKYWGRKKITLPNVKEGSIVEFEYTLQSPNVSTIDEWYFQEEIPVNYAEYTTKIPEYFNYNTRFKGFVTPKIESSSIQRKVDATYNEMVNQIGGARNERGNYSFEFVEKTTNYFLANVPAIKDEVYVNNVDNYRVSLTHELSFYKGANGVPKFYATDWESVTKTIYDNEDFGTELSKTGYFENEINHLIAAITDPNEKIDAIFNYVKSNMNWNKFTGYYCADGVKKAFKDKTGNVAEINLMLTAMLRHAGFTANPVLISTRSNGIALFPNRSAFNYVISAVEYNNSLILMDATEKLSSPNILPEGDLNWSGRLIRKDGTSNNVDLMPTTLSNQNTNLLYSVDKNGEINGKIRRQLTGQLALDFRQNKLQINKETYLENLENNNNKIEISEYVRENDLDLSKPIVESYTFKSKNDTEVIDNKIYLNPLLFFTTTINPFKQEVREYPIDFGYPIEHKYNVSVEIPEGFQMESIPKPVALATENGSLNFRYIIGTNGNKIQIQLTTTVKEAIFQSNLYDMLKDFFAKNISKENEKIVLSKI
jgi:hypothetical protein